MRHIDVDVDSCARRHAYAADAVLADRRAHYPVRWRIEPHGLLYDHAGPFELGEVGVVRHPTAQHPFELVVQSRLRLRVPCKKVPSPTQGGGGGLVAGEEESEDLVA